jgi:transporter family protein
MTSNWITWALLSATFAALSAIFAKVGVEGVDSNYATLVRTVVILFVAAGIVVYTGSWISPARLAPRTAVFLVVSGLATGGSWLCYFRALQLGDAARVAPIDKLSVVLVAILATAFLGERLTLREWLGVGMIALGASVLAMRR